MLGPYLGLLRSGTAAASQPHPQRRFRSDTTAVLQQMRSGRAADEQRARSGFDRGFAAVARRIPGDLVPLAQRRRSRAEADAKRAWETPAPDAFDERARSKRSAFANFSVQYAVTSRTLARPTARQSAEVTSRLRRCAHEPEHSKQPALTDGREFSRSPSARSVTHEHLCCRAPAGAQAWPRIARMRSSSACRS